MAANQQTNYTDKSIKAMMYSYEKKSLALFGSLLNCAHHTVEFLVVVIIWTRQTFTVSFNMIELSTIDVGLTAWQSFLISIYTLKRGAMTAAKFCTSRHQIAEILSGPTIRAAAWPYPRS